MVKKSKRLERKPPQGSGDWTHEFAEELLVVIDNVAGALVEINKTLQAVQSVEVERSHLGPLRPPDPRLAATAFGKYLCGQWIRRDGDHEAWKGET